MVSKDYVADCFIWKENIDGNYTTTYGYKWLLDKRITPNHQQSSRRWIWKLKAYEINKILHLVCLPPIYSSLIYLCFTRETCPNMFVVRCLLFEETIFHCLRDCSTFKKSMAWSWLHEYQLFFFFSNLNLQNWIRTNSTGPSMCLFLLELWWNWRARNIVCVGKETIFLFQVLAETRKLASIMEVWFWLILK